MLEVQGIEKSYKTATMTQHVLKGISLKFRENEFVSILGQSGSGKSTLLNIIGGLDHYDNGDLIIDGISTKEYRDRDWDAFRTHKIGFIFQSYNLIMHQTLLANVELSMTISGANKKEKKKRAIEALNQVGLGEHIHKKPNQLSGGQMQRVSIARALVNNPSIILADEPTGALDSETSVQIMELLKEIAKDKLVIMVTHNHELAEKYSTRIVTLKDGVIESDSNPVADQETVTAAPSNAKMKGTAMKYGTCLGLSFQNLFSKKGRTIVTAFASSVGIRGIALILSLTNGVQNYINVLEKDTLASYPITISSNAISTGSFGKGSNNEEIVNLAASSKEETPTDAVYADISSLHSDVDLSSLINTNNLAEFKKYIEDPENEIYQNIDASNIKMTYPIAYSVLQDRGNGYEIISQSNEAQDDLYGVGSMLQGLLGSTISTNLFSVMLPGKDDSELINSSFINSYEMLEGRWPESSDEILLVVDKNNSLAIDTLVTLGLVSQEEFEEIKSAVDNGETPSVKLEYQDIIGKDYYICPEALFYEVSSNDTFYRTTNSLYPEEDIPAGAIKMKVTGVIKPVAKSSSAISSGMAYTNALNEMLIELTNDSEVIKAQLTTPEINVLTGKRFDGTDSEKSNDTINIKEVIVQASEAMDDEELAQFYDLIKNKVGAASTFGAFFGDFPSLAKAETESEKGKAVRNFIQSAVNSKMLLNMVSKMFGLPEVQEYTYDKNLETFGYIDVDSPSSINIYCDTYEEKQKVQKYIENYNANVEEANRISYTDYVKMLSSYVSGMVQAISLVLIAFASISLIVSCIMIGIITHISVLERTREIGILRALGASKKNIRQVFSAETFIIGLFSGVIGVGIGSLLGAPITVVAEIILKMNTLTFKLTPSDMIFLIVISTIITMIGGIAPAKKAAKKDPVAALRAE